jgi:hypothetical protein
MGGVHDFYLYSPRVWARHKRDCDRTQMQPCIPMCDSHKIVSVKRMILRFAGLFSFTGLCFRAYGA